jgi:endogenous inhibitor of DNA gyrase (YacG/DUF329 family)
VTAAPLPRTCAGCGRPAPPRDANPAWPFCSARCRLLDLGRWLGEDYRIPGARAGDGAVRPPGEEEP